MRGIASLLPGNWGPFGQGRAKRPVDGVTDEHCIADVPADGQRPGPRHARGAQQQPPRLPAPPVLRPAPSFAQRPSRPPAETAPMHACVQPPVPAAPLGPAAPPQPGLEPAIGDLMNRKYPALPPADPPAPDCSALPYTQPGWTGVQMTQWLANGEWEPADAELPAGYERNAADMAVALVRGRARAVAALTRGCEGLGLPVGLAPVLWQRAEELTRASRAAALRKAAEQDLAEAGAAHRRQGTAR